MTKELSDAFDVLLGRVHCEMNYTPSAVEQIEQRMDRMISELDEFCKLATNPETLDLIEANKIALGQIVTRAQLVASFLIARQPGALRIVRNG